jgi:hypothetical protein
MEQEPSINKIKVVKEIILEVFHFLEERYTYIPVLKDKHDKTFIESIDIEYINQPKRRKIVISYSKNKVYEEVKYTLSCSIIRTPYLGVEDFLSLSDYLKSIGKDFSTSMVSEFNKPEAKSILLTIATSLKVYALNIIQGKQWLDNYYSRKD